MASAEDGQQSTASGGEGKKSGGVQQGQTGGQQQSQQPPKTQPLPPAQPAPQHHSDGGSESEEDDGTTEILEESPDRRWSKRREQVKQRDVPGIDAAYLAMDNETGNEVVWNEVQFSERKNFRAQEEKINAVFDSLTQLVHTNLVKFHKYWTDSKSDKPRIIFITEYMSSGSMSQFLQRTKKAGTSVSMKSWKKWTAQILSALNYLHSYKPPITHGNLTCNTVFIQQNGLIKIGCVAPDAIHHHVKTCKENFRHLHYIAPEYEQNNTVTPAADIYAFGVCALEMAMTGALVNPSSSAQAAAASNGGSGSQSTTTAAATAASSSEGPVPEEVIEKAVRQLEDPLQRDFIEQCLRKNPLERPTAQQLLFHPVFFDVCTLRLIAAHEVIDSQENPNKSINKLPELNMDDVVCTIGDQEFTRRIANQFILDLNKFLDEVREGIYPIGAGNRRRRRNESSRTVSTSSELTTEEHDAEHAHGHNNADTSMSSLRSRRDSSAPSGNQAGEPASNAQTQQSLSRKNSTAGRQKSSDSHHPTTSSASANSQHSRASPSGDVNTAASSAHHTHPSTTSNDYHGGQQSGVGSSAASRLTRGQSVTEADGAPTRPFESSAGGNGTGPRTRDSNSQNAASSRAESAEREAAQFAKDDQHKESRSIRQMKCTKEGRELKLWVQLEDLMNRQLTTELSDEDSPASLADNLVYHGFICEEDRKIVERELSTALTSEVIASSSLDSESASSTATVAQGDGKETQGVAQAQMNNVGGRQRDNADTSDKRTQEGAQTTTTETVPTPRKPSAEGPPKRHLITVTPVPEKDRDKPPTHAPASNASKTQQPAS